MNNAFYNRLKKNFKQKSKWAKNNNYECFRLYERDIPDFPWIIDIYKDCAVFYDQARPKDLNVYKKKIELSLNSLTEITSIEKTNIYFKSRQSQKGKEQYSKISNFKKFKEVLEGRIKFKVNLNDYLDTGLFLDHRPLREKIYRQIMQQSKTTEVRFLNLFCYTASFSVYAAKAGAKVTSVDLSKTYINWAKDNFKLNGLSTESHQFIIDDVFQYLKQEKNSYDIIFLDPPTFSNSKKTSNILDIQKDQTTLVKGCMSLLKKEGVLFFSNNLRSFKLENKLLTEFEVQDIGLETVPIDFKDKRIHNCFKIKHLKS